MIVNSAPPISAWTSQLRPKMCTCTSTRIETMGCRSAASTAPGRMNRKFGLCTSRNRRWRQPSRKLESFESPPRGWYSIFDFGDLEVLLGRADHHLGGELHAGGAQVRRSSTSRRSARMPQWASSTPCEEGD